ncbi:hypothetical protein GIB67_023586 [Kingdonia uniflora]|uniref:Uncharacterized protein n=1 Tax=Kingdonia uniflora TaxID=39325 RepID=A0A7J7PA01_9MAGN|nr:hypothetical protein GIB67_023586 [Kingdonia uniflora]
MDKSVMPKVFSSHHHWYSATLDSLKTVSSTTKSDKDKTSVPEVIYTYENAMHGFSVALSSKDLQTLQKMPGFVSLYPDRSVEVDTTHTTSFLSLNSVAGLWPASNYGSDVIIGVIDSGVWPESNSYKDDGMGEIPKRWKGKCEPGEEFDASMCNRKLIGARYFNKGLIAETPDLIISMNSARDTDGHGTHTSSTAAGNYVEGVSFFGYANGTARGVAPRARIAVYKVLWDEGSFASDVIAGMDQAIADGVDVISISMGFGRYTPFYEDPIAIASFAAMEKATLTLGNGLVIAGWSLYPIDQLLRAVPLVYNETLTACNSSDLLSKFAERAIVICKDVQKSYNWELYYSTQDYSVGQSTVSGAIYVLNEPHSLYQELDYFHYPGVIINSTDRAKVINYAKSTTEPKVTIKFQQTFVGGEPAPFVAKYSSRGPSRIHPGILKPDLIAPGTKVLAAWVPNKLTSIIGRDTQLSSNYNMIQGASMACPHASGVAALLKGAHPEWSPAAIRSAMMTTANPLDNTNKTIKDNDGLVPATPLDIGSGHINPNRALNPGLIYDVGTQDYGDLLCSMNLTHEQFLTITRTSSYNCSNPSSDLNYPSFIALFNKTSTVQEFTKTATNVGSGASTYRANIIQPNGTRVTVTPKKLLSFTVRIKDRKQRAGYFVSGSFTWIDGEGKHRGRSPIVVMDA